MPRVRKRIKAWVSHLSGQPSSSAPGTLVVVQKQSLPSNQTNTIAVSRTTPLSQNTLKQGLWTLAFARLSSEEQEIIQPFETNAGLDVQGLQAAVERKRDECIESSWKFNMHGRQVILRDVASKILSSIQTFISIGDIISNFDPVHAGLPWAGVRFLLQVSINDSEQMGALLAGLEKVAYLLSRCKVYELLYLQGKPSDQEDSTWALDNLKETMVSLYAAVLRFLAKAIMLYDKRTLSRTFHGTFRPLEIANILKEFQSLEDRLGLDTSSCERVCTRNLHQNSDEVVKGLQDILAKLEAPLLRVDSSVAALYQNMEGTERAEILKWISPIPYEKSHLNARQNRTQGTGKWLLNHDLYLEWRKSSAATVLWLRGDPGAGKTKLVTSVVDDLKSTFTQSPNNEGLAFFYCDRHQDELRKPVSILASFVRQLSIISRSSLIQKSIVQLYHETQQDGFPSGTMKLDESKELLRSFIRLMPQVTLVIDALDECHPETRGDLVKTLYDFMSESPNPLKILVSSRPDRDLECRFKDGPNLEITATNNQSDIEAFIDDRMANSEPFWQRKIRPETRMLIQKIIGEKSSGMFQWVKLQMDFLLTMYNDEDILERLRTLPPTPELVDAYDEIHNIIQKKPGRMPVIANRVFQWLMCCTLPASTVQLVAAVCQDPDSNEIGKENVDIDHILEACHNLVVLDRDHEVCRFSHLSVWEYFSDHWWSFETANGYAAKVCLTLLNHPTVVQIQNEAIRDPETQNKQSIAERIELWNRHVKKAGLTSSIGTLIRYAQFSWPIHVQRHGQEKVDSMLTLLLKSFLGSMNESSLAYRTWHSFVDSTQTDYHDYRLLPMMARDQYGNLKPNSSASLAIALYGFHKIILDWWDHGFQDVNYRNKNNMTLLHLAAIGGNARCDTTSTIKALLDMGADIEAQYGSSKPYTLGTPLTIACKNRNEETVRFLLGNGADPEAGGVTGASALYAAARIGSLASDITLVAILLERGANVNAPTGPRGATALHIAAMIGDDQVINLLVANGADISFKHKWGDALALAARHDSIDALRALFENIASGKATGGDPDDALWNAVYYGKDEAVKLLLEHGANANFCHAKTGDSMIQIATENDSKGIVECLVEHGADPMMVIYHESWESKEEFKSRKQEIYRLREMKKDGPVEQIEDSKLIAECA